MAENGDSRTMSVGQKRPHPEDEFENPVGEPEYVVVKSSDEESDAQSPHDSGCINDEELSCEGGLHASRPSSVRLTSTQISLVEHRFLIQKTASAERLRPLVASGSAIVVGAKRPVIGDRPPKKNASEGEQHRPKLARRTDVRKAVARFCALNVFDGLQAMAHVSPSFGSRPTAKQRLENSNILLCDCFHILGYETPDLARAACDKLQRDVAFIQDVLFPLESLVLRHLPPVLENALVPMPRSFKVPQIFHKQRVDLVREALSRGTTTAEQYLAKNDALLKPLPDDAKYKPEDLTRVANTRSREAAHASDCSTETARGLIHTNMNTVEAPSSARGATPLTHSQNDNKAHPTPSSSSQVTNFFASFDNGGPKNLRPTGDVDSTASKAPPGNVAFANDVSLRHRPIPSREAAPLPTLLKDLDDDERALQAFYWSIDNDEAPAICQICDYTGHCPGDCPYANCPHCGTSLSSHDSHFSFQCPVIQKCQRCGDRGHSFERCASQLKRPRDEWDGCDLCGNKGHGEADCQGLWRRYNVQDAFDRAIKLPSLGVVCCYYCGLAGHLGDDCPDWLGAERPLPGTWSAPWANLFQAVQTEVPRPRPSLKRVTANSQRAGANAQSLNSNANTDPGDSSAFYGKKVKNANSQKPQQGRIQFQFSANPSKGAPQLRAQPPPPKSQPRSHLAQAPPQTQAQPTQAQPQGPKAKQRKVKASKPSQSPASGPQSPDSAKASRKDRIKPPETTSLGYKNKYGMLPPLRSEERKQLARQQSKWDKERRDARHRTTDPAQRDPTLRSTQAAS